MTGKGGFWYTPELHFLVMFLIMILAGNDNNGNFCYFIDQAMFVCDVS